MGLRMPKALTALFVAVVLLVPPGCGVEVDLGGDESGAAPEAGTYAGTTSQGLPIAFSVSPNGDVLDVVFAWRARCEDGQVYVNTIVLPGGRLRDGSFRTGGGLETGGIAHVTGSFEGSEATGDLSRSRGTAFGVNCNLSGVEWSAEPGPTPEMPPPSMGGAPGQSL
jgi:hypothetical protein